MPKLTVHDAKGKKVGTYTIEPTDFAPRINKQLLHDAVVMYQANQRQGSHMTKTRSMVAGSSKKLYRQKGTGNARAGSRRSGTRTGGGHIHAINNRDYSYSLPRKALRLATRMAIASKIRDDQITLIDKLEFSEPKTREMVSVLGHLGCQGESLLIATAGYSPNVYKSARNIQRVAVSPAAELNALSVLSAHRLVITTEALDQLKTNSGANGAAKQE
ncbi:50S ribosomal protein L4 [Bythopirellula polymerisocia]|uniref:Large ribosomal subunit protein uL4 n=1 Tax=Bythopirellula polymerisocia TaxID=2528003 RepID=A0A5C6D2Y2_9BACT|nr:50S ribosomal protein L4 [Bythopirellula polymerisocia]TWU29566.1 50S ribosomal protein L4 [Bythopirellula polymerisocia]